MAEQNTVSIFPEYHNIFIEDAARIALLKDMDDTNSDTNWGDGRDLSKMVNDSKSNLSVVFHPYSEMYDVPVTLEINDSKPELNDILWDHIVEAPLEIKSGKVRISNGFPETDALTKELQAGSYRVRICFGGLDGNDPNADEGSDHYLVSVWPAPLRDITVIKQWNGFVSDNS